MGRSQPPGRAIDDHPRHLRIGYSQSTNAVDRSFTWRSLPSWATRASPRHGFIDPTVRGMHPSAPVSFLGGGRRRGQSPFEKRRSLHVAPTRIYRPQRAWDAPVGARFVPPERGQWRRGQSPFRRGGSPRRPDTDLSNPARVGCTRRRPFRSSGGGQWRRGQSPFRSPFRRHPRIGIPPRTRPGPGCFGGCAYTILIPCLTAKTGTGFPG